MKELPKNRADRDRSSRVLDRQIGARIRQRRIFIGFNQDQLAEMIGVTYQQVHKYEKGISRLSAGRLYMIVQALGVDVNFFFEGLSDNQTVESTPQGRLLLALTRHFTSMTDQGHQAALSRLVRAVADTTAHDDNALETKPDSNLSAS